jgi:hypothetical protein
MISMTPTKKMTSNLLYKGMSSIISMYTNKFKKNLFNKIEGLDKVEHEEIYKILMKNDDNVQLTKNSNGIFFNLSKISDETIKDIDYFVSYCFSNKKDLDDYDKKLNDCKNNTIIHINFNEPPKKEEKENWDEIVPDKQKVSKYIEYVITDNELSIKKKINTKFNTAKKKYSKSVILNDVNLCSTLKKEKYIII